MRSVAKVMVGASKRQGQRDADTKCKEDTRFWVSSSVLGLCCKDDWRDCIWKVPRKQPRIVWRMVEAAGDSGAVDFSGNPKDFQHLQVKENDESRRHGSWACAGEKITPKF
jgi:hypothetical protein